ncbi:hypothetical protein KBP46_10035 [Chryseobacterium sp. PCH239]|uniref:hypothetical protein n=1 Tax=Chryseobacterium sp. PCH239 TaxID=2825845 RepID=UPI001C120C26|nr:hypothetical protein [Chryseobacterium sp. PCH239]QWT88135.1 hypothetical protein KBP46_10035 [Chryseobacterium sp. PCH239]
MNKDELLKIYSAYLPYDLEFEAFGRRGKINEIQLKPDFVLGLDIDSHVRHFYPDSGLPILYDLSYLTKEIEHEGKKITPIVELAKLGTGEQECGVTNGNLGTCYVNAKNEKKGFFIYHPEGYFIWQVGKNAEPMIVKNQLKLFQKLLEWHFNIFSLPESEYINKATLTQKQ